MRSRGLVGGSPLIHLISFFFTSDACFQRIDIFLHFLTHQRKELDSLKEGVEIILENMKAKFVQYFPNSVGHFVTSMKSIIKV